MPPAASCGAAAAETGPEIGGVRRLEVLAYLVVREGNDQGKQVALGRQHVVRNPTAGGRQGRR